MLERNMPSLFSSDFPISSGDSPHIPLLLNRWPPQSPLKRASLHVSRRHRSFGSFHMPLPHPLSPKSSPLGETGEPVNNPENSEIESATDSDLSAEDACFT